MKKMALILLVSAFALSCEGKIEFQGESEDTFTPGTTKKDPDKKDPIIDPELEPICAGCTALKRLTQTEYRKSVESILGYIPNTRYDNLPSDGKTGAFRTNIANLDVDSVESYRSVAEEIGERFIELDSAQIGCDSSEATCVDTLLDRVGPLFYRRSLVAEERASFETMLTLLKDAGATPQDQIRILITALLQSPNFVYKVERGAATDREDILKLNGQELAVRLSYFLWKSGPDKPLIEAAENGDLDTAAGLLAEARRMLADERAMVGIIQFHREWLGIDELEDKVIEDEEFMGLRDDMLAESEKFITEIFLSDVPTLRTLFTAKFSNPSAKLAAFYNATPDENGRIIRDDGHHSGILTQGSFLAAHSSEEKTTAIFRGLAVMENISCTPRRVPGPIDDVIPEDPADSLREQLATITSPTGCMNCHAVINPIGFGFGHFANTGRFREVENGHTVDDSGELLIWNKVIPFEGTVELADILTERKEVHECLTKSWFEYALGRRYDTADEASLESVRQAYNTSGKNIRELMIGIITTPSFQHRRLPEVEE